MTKYFRLHISGRVLSQENSLRSLSHIFSFIKSYILPKCPSRDEWIKKMWYIYTMEYYPAIKRNEIRSFVETQMDLEIVIQSEVSQKEKNKYHILTHICGT